MLIITRLEVIYTAAIDLEENILNNNKKKNVTKRFTKMDKSDFKAIFYLLYTKITIKKKIAPLKCSGLFPPLFCK